jgi:hypothetical protein
MSGAASNADQVLSEALTPMPFDARLVSFVQYAHCIIWFGELIGGENGKIFQNLVASLGTEFVAESVRSNRLGINQPYKKSED